MRNIRLMIFCCATLMLLAGSLPLRAQTAQDYTSQLLAFAPADIVADSRGSLDRYGNPSTIYVHYVRADFGGTGQFDYFVVGYNDGGLGAVLLLKLSGGQFQFVNDPLPHAHAELGGGSLDIELRDIDNDGVPEVRVNSYGTGTHYTTRVLKWNGSGLQDISPPGGFDQATLYDVDHNGTLDVVQPPECPEEEVTGWPTDCGAPFTVYRYNAQAGKYELAFTSPTDPTGLAESAASGELLVGATKVVSDPSQFPLAEIQLAAQGLDTQGGVVTVRAGNLAEVVNGGPAQRADVTDVDASSLVLGPDIHPLSVIVVPPGEASGNQQASGQPSSGSSGFQGAILQLQFDRGAVLAYLPKVQLDQPLAVGETLHLPLRGKMKNGTQFAGGVTVKVTGAPSSAN